MRFRRVGIGWLPSLFVLATVAVLQIGSNPIPNETGNTPKEPQTNGMAQVPQDPKLAKKRNGFFNSFLCGVGYTYDQTRAKCVNSHKKEPEGTQRAAEVPEETESSVEPIEDENVNNVDGTSDGFFPLECGINYRYLRKRKICKPVTKPIEIGEDVGSSSNENWEDAY